MEGPGGEEEAWALTEGDAIAAAATSAGSRDCGCGDFCRHWQTLQISQGKVSVVGEWRAGRGAGNV